VAETVFRREDYLLPLGLVAMRTQSKLFNLLKSMRSMSCPMPFRLWLLDSIYMIMASFSFRSGRSVEGEKEHTYKFIARL